LIKISLKINKCPFRRFFSCSASLAWIVVNYSIVKIAGISNI